MDSSFEAKSSSALSSLLLKNWLLTLETTLVSQTFGACFSSSHDYGAVVVCFPINRLSSSSCVLSNVACDPRKGSL